MTHITKQEAKRLGLTLHTKPFKKDEIQDGLFDSMLIDIRQHNPEARIVSSPSGPIIAIRKVGYSKSYRPDNPKALRGNFPPPCSVVGRESIR